MNEPAKSAIVRIYASNNVVGAGFLVSEKHILTCAHVINAALGRDLHNPEKPTSKVCVDFPWVAKDKMLAQVVEWVKPRTSTQQEEDRDIFDIAVLELESSPLPEKIQPVQLVVAEDWWGHRFQVFGFPSGHENGVWASGVLRKPQASGWVQMENVKETGYSVEPGFSGALVWDEQLQGFVGMTVAAETRQTKVKAAFMIPTTQLVMAWPQLSEPYRGLFAFGKDDNEFFFGRETFTEQLVAAVQAKSLVAVVGNSGSGKSSVVFAGLIPKLRQEGSWLIESFRPQLHPFCGLVAALERLHSPGQVDGPAAQNQLKENIQQGKWALSQVMTSILELHPGKRLLLVVDQFEELYTLGKDNKNNAVRQCFLDQLLEAISHTPNFTLILTLRADFLGYTLSNRSFIAFPM